MIFFRFCFALFTLFIPCKTFTQITDENLLQEMERPCELVDEVLEIKYFKVYDQKRMIPKTVFKYLREQLGSSFKILDSNKKWYGGYARKRKEPPRQMLFFAQSDQFWILSYNINLGWSSSHTNILIMKIENNEIVKDCIFVGKINNLQTLMRLLVSKSKFIPTSY